MAKIKDKKAKKAIQYSSAKEVIEKMDQSDFAPTHWKLPEGVESFRFKKEGTYKVNIIPYVVGDKNPHADEGIIHYEITMHVHNDVGPERKKYICRQKQIGEKCPICDHIAKLRVKGTVSDKLLYKMEPKPRQLYIFQDLQDEKKLKIYETAFYKSFGELLKSKIGATSGLLTDDEDDDTDEIDYSNFFHFEDGMVLFIKTEEDKFNGRAFFKPVNIEMRPRKNPLDEALAEEAPCLDDCLVIPEYDELKEIFLNGTTTPKEEGAEEEDEEEEKKPKKKAKAADKKKKPKDEEEEDEDDDEEESKDEDDEDDEDDDEGDDEDSDDEESDDDSDEDECPCDVGDEIEFTQKVKGKEKKLQGTVEKVDEKKKLIKVACDDLDKPAFLAFDDESIKKLDDEEFDADEEDEEDDLETEDEPEESDDDEEDDDEDDEDDEEEPVKKKAKKKEPAKKKAKDEDEDDEFDDAFDDEDDEDEDDWLIG